MRSEREQLILLKDRLDHMTADELKDFCDGTLNAAVIAQEVFLRRFPLRYASWEELVGLPTDKDTVQ